MKKKKKWLSFEEMKEEMKKLFGNTLNVDEHIIEVIDAFDLLETESDINECTDVICLGKNLKEFIESEKYELCEKIKSRINFLKNNKE